MSTIGMSSDKYVFVHVPKSGGTTLRYRIHDALKDDVFYDYSIHAVETSPLVRQHILAHDFKGLCDKLAQRKRFFLMGHFLVKHYQSLLSVAQFMIFFREPFDRITSEYNHHVKHNKYKESFKTYIEDPRFRNQQSRMAGDVPLDAYSFIGLYENYEEDMGALFARLGLGGPVPRENVGTYGEIDKMRLRTAFEEQVRALNTEDYALYEGAKALRAGRLAASRRCR